MQRILLIDDDYALTQFLTEYLCSENFTVQVANNGFDGLKLLRQSSFDLVLLDIMMPQLDGLAVLQLIRQQSQVPVLMLTARGEDTEKAIGLENGADDYLAKPCLPRELVARIKAVLRRTARHSAANMLQSGPLQINPQRRLAILAGQELDLTGAEFRILHYLACNIGAVLSREQISEGALGRSYTLFDRSIDVHISHIRQKLGKTVEGKNWIEAVRGMGYVLLQQQEAE